MQAGFQRRVFAVELVAVEGQRGLQPQRVPRPQSCRDHPIRSPLLQDTAPEFRGLARRTIDLKAILTGVACAGNHRRQFLAFNMMEAERPHG